MTEPGSSADGSVEAEWRFGNALKWIEFTAGMHYWGDAFDPKHMRAIAIIAGDALAGKELPSFEEKMVAAREYGLKQAEKWADIFTGPDEPEDETGEPQ